MIYNITCTAPPNTDKEHAVESEVLVSPGVLTSVVFIVPPGCFNLAHYALFHQEHQIYPTNPDIWLGGDGMILPFATYYEIHEKDTRLVLKVYNEDDTYEHTITALCVVTSWEKYRKGEIETVQKGDIMRFFGVL